jgi:hypothetical protein
MTTPLRIVLAALTCSIAMAVGSGAALRTASADAEIDVTVFYTTLEPYGDWVHLPPYGWAWVPENVEYDWRPYTVGQWSWVEPYGWMWISAEPWGWATYHYGRWLYTEDYGWAWLPGTTWAPAWVVFRYGDPWVGWAPMPPGPNWRPDAVVDVTVLNVNVNLGAHAWTFVPLRHFADGDLRPRAALTAYNSYLVQRTQWSTRYAPVEGGFSNRSIDVAIVEKARNAPIPRRRLREAPAPEKGSGVRVDGDAVVVYRPRIAAKPPAQQEPPRARGNRRAGPPVELDAWTAQRQAAMKAHLEAQRRALEAQGTLPPGQPDPNPTATPEDAAKRREAVVKAIEDEQKRVEALHERQRKRREREAQPPMPAPPEKPKDDDESGKKGDGSGKKDGGPGKKDDPGMK